MCRPLKCPTCQYFLRRSILQIIFYMNQFLALYIAYTTWKVLSLLLCYSMSWPSLSGLNRKMLELVSFYLIFCMKCLLNEFRSWVLFQVWKYFLEIIYRVLEILGCKAVADYSKQLQKQVNPPVYQWGHLALACLRICSFEFLHFLGSVLWLVSSCYPYIVY